MRMHRHTRWIPGSLAAALLLVVGGTAAAQVEDDLKAGDKCFDDAQEAKDFERCAAHYDRAIKKAPGRVTPEAYGKRAAIYFILEQYEDGLQFVVQRAETQHPGAPEILEQKALLLWQLESKPDAIKVAEEVVAKRPETFTNQQIIGEWYAGRDAKKAIEAYEAYLKHRPGELERGDVEPRARLGFAYLRAGSKQHGEERNAHFERAVEQFDTLLKKHRNRRKAELNARNGLCAAYTGQGKFDQAITVCEQIISNPNNIDRTGAVWYNLGRSYLSKRQAKRARTAGREFTRMRRNSPKGYILVGDAYYQEGTYEKALEAYLKAESLVRGDKAVDLGIKMGRTYRRMGDEHLPTAIAKLSKARESNPNNLELARELGLAYLDYGSAPKLTPKERAEQDKLALTAVAAITKTEPYATASERDKTAILSIAARAHYNLGKYDEARKSYLEARAIRPNDVRVKIGLVQTINMQAYQVLSEARPQAEKLLLEAREVDPKSTLTNRNLAVLALDEGDCDKSRNFLRALRSSRRDALIYHRLMGRTYLCGKQPNLQRASKHYAEAEKEARNPNAQANLTLAEIYTEWGPMLLKSNLDDAIDKLETAVQFSAQSNTNRQLVGNAAQRNLALALFRRGWRNMRAGNERGALSDFERAARNPNLLKGSEPLAFDFSHALALLESGNSQRAAKMFNDLAKKGNQSAYLKSPFDAIGSQFFDAYARYRSGNTGQQRQAAIAFGRLAGRAKGALGNKVRELESSAWEYVAYDQFRNGRAGAARTALGKAKRGASGQLQRRVDHNQLVLQMGTGADQRLLGQFAKMGGNPPEALVNLGIMYDRAGKARDAYDAWKKAGRTGGATVQKWIGAKQRIFGFP